MENDSMKKHPIGPPLPKIVITSLPFITGIPELRNKMSTYREKNIVTTIISKNTTPKTRFRTSFELPTIKLNEMKYDKKQHRYSRIAKRLSLKVKRKGLINMLSTAKNKKSRKNNESLSLNIYKKYVGFSIKAAIESARTARMENVRLVNNPGTATKAFNGMENPNNKNNMNVGRETQN